MQRDIHKRPKLLIISDTAVFENYNGEIEAFEPVVREIDHFGDLFSTITWIAAKHDFRNLKKNVKKVDGNINVNYILFDVIGGRDVIGMMKIIKTYFILIPIIYREIRKADVIHTRGPSHPAIIAAFMSLFFKKKVFWQKYAGNWIRKKEAMSYKFQKFLMSKSKHSVVTINGRWDNQEQHILTFENPCLTQKEREDGLSVTRNKNYNERLDFVFVGRLEDAKGVQRIISAFADIESDRIGTIHLVGDGPMRERYEQMVGELVKYDVVFHGMLDKNGVADVMAKSHIAMLPSDSEGFPKVVAEAANFGCVNIVSDISCLSQYIINGETGFLMESLDECGLRDRIEQCLSKDYDLRKIAEKAYSMADKFTYDYYNERIVKEIIGREGDA